jgi:hypothetical protein
MDVIVRLFPVLWEHCEEENILRNSILAALTHVMSVLRAESHLLQPFALHVLSSSVDPNNTSRFVGYLNEQAQDLWLSAAVNACQPSDGLRDLFRLWLVQAPGTADEVEAHMKLFDSYVLLDGRAVLGVYGKEIHQALVALAEVVGQREDGAADAPLAIMCNSVELLVQCFPQEGLFACTQLVQRFVVDVCASAKQASAPDNNQYVQLGGRVREETALCPMLDALGRVLHSNEEGLLGCVRGVCGEDGAEEALYWLLRGWVGVFPCFKQPYQKKLASLAMCTLLPMSSAMLGDGVLNGVLGHCANTSVEQSKDEPMDWKAVKDGLNPERLTETERMQLLTADDPLTDADVRAYTRAQLQLCQQKFPEALQHALAQTASDVVEYVMQG